MHMKRLFILTLAIAALYRLAAEPLAKKITIGTAGFDLPPSIVARDILIEAYAHIGYNVEFAIFPPGRMIASLDSGTVDALILAEASFPKEHPGSIAVATPIWVDELVAFSKLPIVVNNWEDLRPWRVGYIRGMLIIERKLASGFDRYPADDPFQLFRMLGAGHIDVTVTSRSIGGLMIGRLSQRGVSRVSESLETVPNYHIIGQKNAELARLLSAELSAMEKSGRIAAITRESLARIFPKGIP